MKDEKYYLCLLMGCLSRDIGIGWACDVGANLKAVIFTLIVVLFTVLKTEADREAI